MEKMGTPNMILEELKIAKQEIETLKSKIEAKEKSLVNYRADTSKLRTENFDLKRQMVNLRFLKNGQMYHHQNFPRNLLCTEYEGQMC